MAPDGETDRDGATFDPFADLFLTLIAALLPAILVLLPTLPMRAPEAADVRGIEAPSVEVTIGGRRAWPLVAQADGLRLTGEGNRLVALDAVPDDPGLRRVLEALRDGGEPLLVIVEPGGLEAAFLLEPVAALHGPPILSQVRAARPCADARQAALLHACAAAGGAAPPTGVR